MASTETQTYALCDNPGLERTRFFQRQLVTAADFTQDQAYFLEKSRRHNRLLHGWGVVCGARCKRGQGDCEVVIEPGYVLGPYGDEIVIDREVTIDVCKQDLDGNVTGPCGQPTDPWCSNVRVDRRAGDKLYLAIRYAECQDRPVRVMSGGCGCDPQECEYSRIRDSYALRVLTKLPSAYSDPMSQPDLRTAWECHGGLRVCPPCPPDPWVILADVTLGADGKIATLDCFAHRRYVVSFADMYFLCQKLGPPTVATIRVLGEQPAEVVSLSAPASLDTQPGPDAPVLTVPFLPRAIEVGFTGAAVDPRTVTETSFIVVKVTAAFGEPVQGNATLVLGTNNTYRWTPQTSADIVPGTFYILTLVGSPDILPGTTVIKSEQGLALDGEPTQLPSGDGQAGGNFKLALAVLMG